MKILIVDDEADIRLFLRASLEGEGWEVIEAPTGEDGLREYESGDPDVIVLDYKMPGMTGTEAGAKLRAQGFEGPIILFSGYLDKEKTEEATGLKITPCSKADIQSTMRAIRALAAELQT